MYLQLLIVVPNLWLLTICQEHAFSHLLLTAALWGGWHRSHFLVRETESWRCHRWCMLSGKAVIQTQDSLVPEPAFLTASIFLFSFPVLQSAGKSWLHFEVSDSTVHLCNALLVDRRVATQWPWITAALFSSQPMTDVLLANGCQWWMQQKDLTLAS